VCGVTIKGDVVKNQVQEFEPLNTTWKSVILPVSDENGYEVFGSYQYGRGLDILPNVSFDTLLRQDPTRLLNDVEIDQFLQSLTDSKANGDQISKTAAESIGGRLGDNLATAYFRLTGDKYNEGSQEKKAASLATIANALMTQNDLQVVQNVPIRLKDIRPETRGNAACDCRGDTSDIAILLGDRGVEVRGQVLSDSLIVQKEKDLIEGRGGVWKKRQDFLRGVQDTSAGEGGVLPSFTYEDAVPFDEGALEYILGGDSGSVTPLLDKFKGLKDEFTAAYGKLIAEGSVIIDGFEIALGDLGEAASGVVEAASGVENPLKWEVLRAIIKKNTKEK